MPANNRERDRDGGFALIAVLGFLLVLSLFLAPFAISARTRALSSAYQYDQYRLETAARALSGYLAWRLATDNSWRGSVDTRSSESSCAVGSTHIKIRIMPHARLIYLNAAEPQLLQHGMDQLGIAPTQARTLTGQIVEFRTPRSMGDLEAKDIDNGFKHAPFEDISELHDFEALKTISPIDLGRVFSAYSGMAVARSAADPLPVSQHYTIETEIMVGDKRFGEASIYSIGDAAAGSTLMAIFPSHGQPDLSASQSTCSPLIDDNILATLREGAT